MWEKYLDYTFPTLESVDFSDLKTIGLGCPILFVYQGAFVAALIYFFMYYYNDDITSNYLVPQDSTTSYQVCSTVSITVDGIYSMDTSGSWNGAMDYSYSKSVYDMSFTTATATDDSYKSIVDGFASELSILGSKSKDRDIAWNLVAFSGYKSSQSSGYGKISLSTTGDASVMYDQTVGLFGFGNKNQYCTNSMTITYDSARSAFDINIPVTESYSQVGNSGYEVTVSEPCGSVFSVVDDFSYSSSKGSSSVDLYIDARSLATAMAVNYGIMNISSLTAVEGFSQTVQLSSNSLTFSSFIDASYPGMKPIICSSLDSIHYACLVKTANVWFFPTTSHTGRLKSSQCWKNQACHPSTVSPSITPTPTAAPTAFSTNHCPRFYSEGGQSSVNCIVQACGGDTIVASGCSSDGGSCTGDTYFSLYSTSGGVPVTSLVSNDNSCGYCSKVSYTVPGSASSCSLYELQQSCKSQTCSGYTALSTSAVLSPNQTPSPTPSPTVSPSEDTACDTFDIMFGLVYFPYDKDNSRSQIGKFTSNFLSLRSTYGYDRYDQKHIDNNFPAMSSLYAASKFSNIFNISQEFSSQIFTGYSQDTCPTSFESSFSSDFSQLCPSQNCSMLMFSISSSDDYPMLNKYAFTTTNGSYHDILYYKGILDTMASTPPTQLTQDYLNCHDDVLISVYNSIGKR